MLDRWLVTLDRWFFATRRLGGAPPVALHERLAGAQRTRGGGVPPRRGVRPGRPPSAGTAVNHLSKVTNHPSKVTNHLSKVTNHPSKVTNHQVITSPPAAGTAVNHLSKVTNHPS